MLHHDIDDMLHHKVLSEASSFYNKLNEIDSHGRTYWLEPTNGMPVSMLTEMIKDPLAGYWIHGTVVSRLVAVVIRGTSGKRLHCFNLVVD